MPNPVDDYFLDKEAAKTQRKQNEQNLWQTWKDNGQKPAHLEPLLKLYEPVFAQKVRQLKAPQVPESAFRGELHKRFIKQLETYDPTKGAALNTHVEYGLRKLQRFNNRYQNLAYIPEAQAELIGPLGRAQSELGEQFGRAPTTEELTKHYNSTRDPADHVTAKRVDTVLKAIRRDVPTSRSGGTETPFDYSSSNERANRGFEEQQIAVAKNILEDLFPGKPHLHSVFNYTYGTNDHPKITRTGQLAKKMGTSESNVSRWKTIIGETLAERMNPKEEDD